MSTMEPLYALGQFNTKKLSREERLFLEGELFLLIFAALKKKFLKNKQYKYLTIIYDKEHIMRDHQLLCLILREMIINEDYTLEGLARYTYTPTEVIQDVFVGKNKDPSITFFRKTIELHRTSNPGFYNEIFEKIRD